MTTRVKNVVFKHVVILREYERGWGSKDFYAAPYPSAKEALAKVDATNKLNNCKVVPDYYIIARYQSNVPLSEVESINDN